MYLLEHSYSFPDFLLYCPIKQNMSQISVSYKGNFTYFRKSTIQGRGASANKRDKRQLFKPE